MGCQTKDFFAALEQIICSGSTATLSAITACNHFAGVSVKTGEIHALRYRNQTGDDALAAFRTLEIKSFSKKTSLSNLCYTPQPTELSNQNLSLALGDRLTLPTSKNNKHDLVVDTSMLNLQSEQVDEPTSNKQRLFYRGQPVLNSEYSASKVAPTSDLKYRGQSPTGSQSLFSPDPKPDPKEVSPKPTATNLAPRLEYRGSHSNPFMRLGKSST